MQDTTARKNLLLLIQLRWIAVFGQVATIAYVHYWLGIALPLAQMGMVVVFLLLLNALSLLRYWRSGSVSNTGLFLEMLLDVAALTLQLYLSGGASNPFVFLFLLQVILGAVLLKAWSVWSIVAITSACFVLLTFFYRPIATDMHHGSAFLTMHIHGMFICFVLAACLLVFFITRINRNIGARDQRLAELRQQSAEEDLIVRMGLLASGAAHELGTPLSTLSVILNDWRRMPQFKDDPELAQELSAMQGQLTRCKTIVSGILMSSGEARGEGTVRTTVNGFLDGLVAEWSESRPSTQVKYRNMVAPDQPIVSDIALKQVLFNVLDNAFDVSPHWIELTAMRNNGHVVIAISDAGPGFDNEMLAEFGRPYRSSKNRTGSGLGLFLVVNVLRKLGGSVTAANRPEGGAIVTLTLPLAALSAKSVAHGD
ncbi:HAMP domain-containing histidine kinase [Aureimonas fodinaquatilis]|uniref:histidine kinase n=1 Tax=Aureimonas fodinaquatilis TaxID=2565783 RepID=A0A5B0E5H8_9HYPH|nr:HAMP domain-containing histidine kinase [Aureimonas fodinaquatilis]